MSGWDESDDRVVSAHEQSGDAEAPMRPQALDDFLGQPEACENRNNFV